MTKWIISIVLIAAIELCSAIPAPNGFKSHKRIRRDSAVVPPERDVNILITALRAVTDQLGIKLCDDDPYKGVHCRETNSTQCVPWQRVCDSSQECGLNERQACLAATVKKYGVEYYEACNGDETNDYCQLKTFKVPRCGRDIKLRGPEAARISSPNFPGKYENDVYCFWRIKIPRASQIIVTIIEFSTEEDYDYVTIGEGLNYTTTDQTKLYLTKTTGKQDIGSKIQIYSNEMFIVFSSDSWNSDKGFMFSVRGARPDEETEVVRPTPKARKEACGADVVVPRGGEVIIQSPGFPGLYSPSLECDWSISLEEGRNIGIAVKSIDTERDVDFIQIGAGADPGENTVATLSGRRAPSQAILIKDNRAWVRFISDNAVERYGFELVARDQPHTDCGGKFTVPVGGSIVVATPFYPDRGYRVSETCLWQIAGAGGIHLSVNFTNFLTQAGSDFVSAGFGDEPEYDWNNYVIEEHSGLELPEPAAFDAGTSSVWIYFSSDNSKIERGFRVEVGDASIYRTGVTPTKKDKVEPDRDCGYEISREEEYDKIKIRSPGNPRYRHFVDCLWEIALPFGGNVEIKFAYFQTEENRDFLTIGNGTDLEDKSNLILDNFSGLSRPDIVRGYLQNIWISFKSDLRNEYRGWSLDIIPIPWQECGGEIYVPEDGSIAIASPGWPDFYTRYTSCRYTIHGPNRHRVIFTIMRFSTVSGFDTLSIGEGCRPTAGGITILDRHSGNDFPDNDQFIPRGDKAWMHFKTTSDYPYTGFLINLADSAIPAEHPTNECEPFDITTIPPTTKAPPPPTKRPEVERPEDRETKPPVVEEPSWYDDETKEASGWLPDFVEAEINDGGLFL